MLVYVLVSPLIVFVDEIWMAAEYWNAMSEYKICNKDDEENDGRDIDSLPGDTISDQKRSKVLKKSARSITASTFIRISE